MKRMMLVGVIVAAAGASNCQSATQRENVELKAKFSALEEKAARLEADNARLKSQIENLMRITDDLTEVLKAQRALGTLPSPAATPKP